MQKPTMPITGRREPQRLRGTEHGVDVIEQLVSRQFLEVRPHLLEVVVGQRRVASPVEQVGSDRPVARGGQPPRHVLDVRGHAERLLDDDHATARVASRSGVVRRHPAARRRDRDGSVLRCVAHVTHRPGGVFAALGVWDTDTEGATASIARERDKMWRLGLVIGLAGDDHCSSYVTA